MSNFLDEDWWGNATVADVKAEIANGADVNEKNNAGWTALMLAAKWNQNPEIIKTLVEFGANIKSKSKGWKQMLYAASHGDEWSREFVEKGWKQLLYEASWNENPEIIKTLVELGTNINEKVDYYGWTPLMHAAEHNENPEVIKTLVELDADVNAKDYKGETPLIYAARWNKNPEVIKTLVELGAKINEEALDYAKERGDSEIIELLEKYSTLKE